MIFHEYGDKSKPAVVLIHGMMTPWQIMLPIARHFEENYRVIIPALDAHTAEEKSSFRSIDDEAEKIADYLCENYGGKAELVAGLSLGGAVAYGLLVGGRVKIRNLIMDGAPLCKSPSLLTKIMTSNYLDIAEKSKARDKRTMLSFSKSFLPEEYLPFFLEFIDSMSDESIKNILESVGKEKLGTTANTEGTRMLYLHGTKADEYLSKKSAKKLAKLYPDAYAVSLKGDGHCQCAIYSPDDWAQIAADFMSRE